MKKLVLPTLVLLLFGATAIQAEGPSSLADMQGLFETVKADKKSLVRRNMKLTASEAEKFWPIYDSYQQDLRRINERLSKLILRYADGYNNNTLSDAEAKALLDEVIEIRTAEVDMRKRYTDKLVAALPEPAADGLLHGFDALARVVPWLADVVVLAGRPRRSAIASA